MKKRHYKLIIKDRRMKKTILIAALIVSLMLLMGAYKGGSGFVIGFYGTVSNVEGDFIISNSVAMADDDSYSTFYNTVTHQAWDNVTNGGEMGDNASVTRANAAVPDTDLRAVTVPGSTANGWKVNVPARGTIKNGWYMWTRYNNAVPADTDAIRDQRLVNIIDGFIQTADNR